ncbi:glycosyltransferase family 4 protein [Jatrophihabitans sp. YIM 134969]
MRIVHVTQPVEAGVAVVVAGLADHQARAGHDVTVICPGGASVGGPLAELSGRVRLVDWQASRSPGPSSFTEAVALRRLVRSTGADVLVLHSAKAGLAGRLAVRGRIATVFVPHAWSFEAVTGPVATLTVAWERLAQRWTRTTVCVSAAEQRRGTRHGVGSDAVVIANGVDTDRFTPGSRHDARATLGLPEVPTVVCVGRLTRQKGQDRLLAAWPAVRERCPDAHLVLVGDGPDRASLQAAPVQGVTFVGAADPRLYLQAADLACLVSRWEAGALVPLEAMASGRSVVAVDVTGVRDALAGFGTVVGAGDDDASITALARALSDRLLDPAGTSEQGRQAREHAVADLSLTHTLARWDDLLAGAA